MEGYYWRSQTVKYIHSKRLLKNSKFDFEHEKKRAEKCFKKSKHGYLF